MSDEALQELVDGNPGLRRTLYALYGVVGTVLGSIVAWYGAAEQAAPDWVVPALAVFAFIGTAFGFGARSKVNAQPAVLFVDDGGAGRTD